MGPDVGNLDGNSPSLDTPNTTYIINVSLVASMGTVLAVVLNAPLTCTVNLTAKTSPTNSPAIIAYQSQIIAQNTGSSTYSVNMYLTTQFTTTDLVPVFIGLNATFQSSDIPSGNGILVIAPATLLISPVQSE